MSANADPKSPSVSVSEAFGLPKNWSMAASLAGKELPDIPEVTHPGPEVSSPDAAPVEPVVVAEPAAAATPADEVDVSGQPKKPVAGEKPAAGDKPAAGAKPAAKPAAAKPAAGDKPSDKPVAGEKPAAGDKPAAVVAPVIAPPATPAKIKVGDKEYTEAELKALLEKPAVVPPVVPVEKPAVVEKKEPTADEIAAAKKKETDWVSATAATIEAPTDDALLDKIVAGGAEGVKALQEIRQRDIATAVLLTRKSIYAELQPVLDGLRESQQPLISNFEKAENERMEGAFKTKFPDLADKWQAVTAVTDVLVKKNSAEIAKMSEEQFFEAVAKETRVFLTALGAVAPAPAVGAAPAAGEPVAAPAAAAPAADAKPVAGDKPAAGAKPAAKPAAPLVKPPGSNAPGAAGATGKGGKGSDKDIIATLW